MLIKILKDPLVHFIVAGFALFVAYSAIVANDSIETDSQIIVVDRAALLTYLQFRTRAFDPDAAEQMLDAMPDETRQRLIEEFTREEALYRDALALGLDEGDDVIRRRMVQKAEFLAQGFVELGLDINENMLSEYFASHTEDYREPPSITFTHVFFDAETRGTEGAMEVASTSLPVLNREAVAFASAIEYGDRYPFHLNYVERGPEEIAAHFGPRMAWQIFELPPSNSQWHGPYASPYGAHLVMVTHNEPARDPELAEVRDRVAADLTQLEIRRRTDEAITSITEAYEVRIDLAPSQGQGGEQ